MIYSYLDSQTRNLVNRQLQEAEVDALLRGECFVYYCSPDSSKADVIAKEIELEIKIGFLDDKEGGAFLFELNYLIDAISDDYKKEAVLKALREWYWVESLRYGNLRSDIKQLFIHDLDLYKYIQVKGPDYMGDWTDLEKGSMRVISHVMSVRRSTSLIGMLQEVERKYTRREQEKEFKKCFDNYSNPNPAEKSD